MSIGVYVYLRLGYSVLVDRITFESHKNNFTLVLTKQKFKVYPIVYCRHGSFRFLIHKCVLNIWNKTSIDHINQNTLDNRKDNLRVASKSQNSFNSKSCHSSTKYKNVYLRKSRNRTFYQHKFVVNKKEILSGSFISIKMCYINSIAKSKQLHKEFYSDKYLNKYELERVTPRKATTKNKKYVGVFKVKNVKLFNVGIFRNGKKINFFGFKTELEAAKHYDSIVFLHNGLNGFFNFPEDYSVFL